MKTIFKQITRDTRINPKSNCTPIMHAGKITKNMQNEPNFNPNAPTKNANNANFTQIFHSLLKLSNRLRRLFLNNCKKMRNFCTFLTLTHLTTCTTKTYITFCPKMPFGRQATNPERREKKNEKRTQFQLARDERQAEFTRRLCGGKNMQNEHNSNTRIEAKRRSASGGLIHTFTHSPKNAKRTQSSFNKRETKKCKTNPI